MQPPRNHDRCGSQRWMLHGSDGERLRKGRLSRAAFRLASRGELYGLAMVHASAGELRRGTIYVTLQRMEQKGYVESWLAEDDGTGPARRKYRLTTGGKRVLKAAQMMRSAPSWQSNP
jgi:DNA-binding PadR family transcriptional regulator